MLESPPISTSVDNATELFSSERLGLCFPYPQGYMQIPYNDTVQLAAPDLPGSDVKGLFWLEISDSNNRTAEESADQEQAYVTGLNGGRSQRYNSGHDGKREKDKRPNPGCTCSGSASG